MAAGCVVSLCLGLSACAGSGNNDAVGVSSPPGTELPFLGLSSANSYLAPAVTLPSAGHSQSIAFCQDVNQLQQLFPTLLVPSEAGASLQQEQALIDRLPSDSPPAVRSDAGALVRALRRINADLASRPPDGSDLVSAIPYLQQSLEQVISYASVYC